jgi:YVTN family beta-propeller protein
MSRQLPQVSRLIASLSLCALAATTLLIRFSLFDSRSEAAQAAAPPSQEEIKIANQPASQGRRITPAGELLLDLTTQRPAVGALPVDFVRSPDHTGNDGRGRYLIAVNSGFGIQFSAAQNRAVQSLAVIDLDIKPAPAVIQNVYFPTPQSANVGAVFSPQAERDGSSMLYVSGGFENKIWMFRFRAGAQAPITPTSSGPETKVSAPFIDITGFAKRAATPRYNDNRAPVYPTGLAISPDGNTLFVANNLGDSLGIVSDVRGKPKLERIDLFGKEGVPRKEAENFVYPYAVLALPFPPQSTGKNSYLVARESTAKVYVSCWNDASVAVIDLRRNRRRVSYISVARHPTALAWDGTRARLYVVNSNADSVSVIDTRYDREIERINVRLAEKDERLSNSPESLALNADGTKLYVANAHSNSAAVIALSQATLDNSGSNDQPAYAKRAEAQGSRVLGFIPTGQYPSAIAVARGNLFIGNGKGTGFENSSLIVNNSGREPNAPNNLFPAGSGHGRKQGGQYSVALVAGNISRVPEPDEPSLARETQSVMRNNNLIKETRTKLFPNASPIKHIIYIIKENRTYDQVFGDLERAGDGTRADGDPSLAIFGAGDAAQSINSHLNVRQNITPNTRALALRFGLFDRFFTNSEASPDGHNWSTAAFSTDYVDKAYRWNYSGRGRTYEYEGFNRLPDYAPLKNAPSYFAHRVTGNNLITLLRNFIPYTHGLRDVSEPDSLYLWDAAARAGLTYRNYGEFIGTISQMDVTAINTNKAKAYPDISPTVAAVPTKRSLENHHSRTYRDFDLKTPDAMTVDSYRAAKEARSYFDPLINRAHKEARFRGVSRFGEWLAEFDGYVAERRAGRADRLPTFSLLRLPNDHTAGLAQNMPTPQFFVADNDYAVGRLVEAVSKSPYWSDTAIFIVEDDAQDGPDHVDAHRSVALVISAYNRPGALIHEFHNTVSLIRTMELLLGLSPMNQLDATAAPMDIFQTQADLRPFQAVLPEVALDNLLTPLASSVHNAAFLRQMRRTNEQNMMHADMAEERALNEIIWFSVRGANSQTPRIARLPIYDAMRAGLIEKEESSSADDK